MDALMGEERDVELSKRTNKKRMFYDEDVCKYFVAGLSPHDTLSNTRDDLGPYEKIKQEMFCSQWEELTQEQKDKYGYDRDLMDFLGDLLMDVDRNIERALSEIANEAGADDARSGTAADRSEERGAYVAKIEELNTQAEKAGDDGDVEQAMELIDKAKAVKAQLDKMMEDEERTKRVSAGGAQRSVVCEVCGNFMSYKDLLRCGATTTVAERFQAHESGKAHKGWSLIRNKYDELKKQNPPRGVRGYRHDGSADEADVKHGGKDGSDGERAKAEDQPPRRRSRDRDQSDRDRRDRDRRRERSPHRDRDRDRERDRDRRRRSRSRSRSRDRHREHDRERHRDRR